MPKQLSLKQSYFCSEQPLEQSREPSLENASVPVSWVPQGIITSIEQQSESSEMSHDVSNCILRSEHLGSTEKAQNKVENLLRSLLWCCYVLGSPTGPKERQRDAELWRRL